MVEWEGDTTRNTRVIKTYCFFFHNLSKTTGICSLEAKRGSFSAFVSPTNTSRSKTENLSSFVRNAKPVLDSVRIKNSYNGGSLKFFRENPFSPCEYDSYRQNSDVYCYHSVWSGKSISCERWESKKKTKIIETFFFLNILTLDVKRTRM